MKIPSNADNVCLCVFVAVIVNHRSHFLQLNTYSSCAKHHRVCYASLKQSNKYFIPIYMYTNIYKDIFIHIDESEVMSLHIACAKVEGAFSVFRWFDDDHVFGYEMSKGVYSTIGNEHQSS